MKITVLFSGIGGGTIGLKRVFPDAEYLTVDNDENVNPDICCDVFKLSEKILQDSDLIVASPPCHGYSPASLASGKNYPKLLDRTIELLDRIGKPYIIENVVGAKSTIKKYDIILRGWFFEATRDLRRPRKFWVNFPLKKPTKLEKIFPYYRLISGGGGWIKEPEKVKRMSIEYLLSRYPELPKGLTMKYYAQIILPEYTEWLGNCFMEAKN